MHYSALIDFANPHQPEGLRLRHAFAQPRQVWVAQHLHEVSVVLDAVHSAAAQGAWCVGCVAYEAAAAFDAALQTHPAQGPLAWFAVYDQALPWPELPDSAAPTVEWQPPLPRADFDTALAAVQQAIAAGEYYQVNFTAQLHGQLSAGSTPQALFAALQRAQPGGYAAFVDMGHEQVLSVSPELFFDWRAGQILTRPMKGTAPRGNTAAEDTAHSQALRESSKERAENVMIVDLLRNDLSRIAQPFSVQVPRLFHTQALPSVWQMTSDVQALTRADCSLADVFAALFPCGSVTGAPKVRAMQAIAALEPQPRGFYCGAVGVVRPGVQAQSVIATFNVPIRTVSVRGTHARCGIGSGITASAQPAQEWREWQLKQAFVQRASAPFDLLETLALVDGNWRHAAAHTARLQHAAQHFGYPWHENRLQAALAGLVSQHPQGLWRVRVRLNAQGEVQAQAYPLAASPLHVMVQLADRPLADVHSEFVRFKTTRRAHYEAFTPTAPQVFDTLLWNTEGELTEYTRGNAAFLLDNRWVTPPLRCGLLPGIGRAMALQAGTLVEAVVRLEDLQRVQALAFVNSLRGCLPAQLNVLSGAV